MCLPGEEPDDAPPPPHQSQERELEIVPTLECEDEGDENVFIPEEDSEQNNLNVPAGDYRQVGYQMFISYQLFLLLLLFSFIII